jgi:sugar/nucleoside kinase (ribokinase family)
VNRVVCVGNAVLDIVVRPVDQFVFGTSCHVEDIELRLGGNGASTAFTLGKLGMAVRLLAPVGRDASGEYLVAKLRSAAVDLDYLEYTSAPTATSAVLVHPSGERALLHRPGASAEGFAGNFDSARWFAGASHLHLGTPFAVPRLRPRIGELLRLAREAGLSTSVDTQWDSTGRWMLDLAACLPFTGLLFANADEARMLTGTSDPATAAARFFEAGVGEVVLKLGREGCALFTPESHWRFPAYAVPVLDTTGAGDCFVGAFLAALARGRSHHDAARFANAVAALSIQQLGAVEGLLSWEETERWMAAQQ